MDDDFIIESLESAIGSKYFTDASALNCEIYVGADPDTLIPYIEVETNSDDIQVEVETRVSVGQSDEIDAYIFDTRILTTSIDELATDDLVKTLNRWAGIANLAMGLGELEFDPYSYLD